MKRPSLSTLIQYTYNRSDLVYRISLLKEFFEFVFFTEHANVVSMESLQKFADHGDKPIADIEFIKQLPRDFLESFTKDSFYDTLTAMSEESENVETLSLVLPVELSRESLEKIGTWARDVIKKDVLLEINVNPEISVGCRFVWKDKLYDFSLAHYIAEHADELQRSIKLPNVSQHV